MTKHKPFKKLVKAAEKADLTGSQSETRLNPDTRQCWLDRELERKRAYKHAS